jgi:proline iminopeptidase
VIVSLIPNSVLVELATAGHSVIDVRERAALEILAAVYDGTTPLLPRRAKQLDGKPGGLGIRLLVGVIGAAAAIESALPAVIPRLVQRAFS